MGVVADPICASTEPGATTGTCIVPDPGCEKHGDCGAGEACNFASGNCRVLADVACELGGGPRCPDSLECRYIDADSSGAGDTAVCMVPFELPLPCTADRGCDANCGEYGLCILGTCREDNPCFNPAPCTTPPVPPPHCQATGVCLLDPGNPVPCLVDSRCDQAAGEFCAADTASQGVCGGL